jgi:hypothetical protein
LQKGEAASQTYLITVRIKFKQVELRIKDANGQAKLSIEIAGEEPGGEWLICVANFNYDGFNANFRFSTMRGNFCSFADQLTTFYSTLKGKAEFRSMEDNVSLQYSTDGLGHVDIDGYLRHSSYEVKVSFLIHSDQTFLPQLVGECNQICSNP